MKTRPESRIFVTAPNPKKIHILQRDNDWAVRREGNKKNSAIKPTQKDAIDEAKKYKIDGKIIVVHNGSGQYRTYYYEK